MSVTPRVPAPTPVVPLALLSGAAALILCLQLSACYDKGVGKPCDADKDCESDLICDVHDGKGTCQEPHDHDDGPQEADDHEDHEDTGDHEDHEDHDTSGTDDDGTGTDDGQ